MPHRYGSFASARVAIPLGAALVVALVLPAILLRTHDTVTLPFAAPAASDSRAVHTQREPKPAPKHHAARHHAKPRGAVRSAAPVHTVHSAPAAHGPAVHVKHAKAQPKHKQVHRAASAKRTAASKHPTAVNQHAVAHPTHHPAHHVHAKKAHRAAPQHGKAHQHHAPKAHGHKHANGHGHGKGKS